ncbi:G-protein coupled receptor dmsr-1 [Drosophila nasuta]|uniref:G-protein coupled receptor dmsr-1 n=1 Tax=Drosophila nasuta TaxID=42062 RepID=UPI00295E26FE|nr:G-protein coupled receptor dmsr-1 [Drosophila nasuta]XP_060657308.1 G-protein coupled receptor dmsr-1 [Drosophila nasuta]
MASGNNDTTPLYCGSGMDNFHTSYKNMHGYVSLVVCILGTIANTLNIIVLTRKEMRSPTNAILTGLAVADLAVMLEYMPYTVHDYILTDSLPREEKLSYSWACFIKFHSIFAQVLHTISIWLTVTLAVWRYIAVGYPQKNRLWCGMRTTIITITTAYVVCVLVVSPSLYLITAITEWMDQLDAQGKLINNIPMTQYVINYNNEMQSMVAALNATPSSLLQSNETQWFNVTTPLPQVVPTSLVARNVTVYRLYHSDLALHNVSLRNTTFLIYSVLIKLIPCIALTILSVRLILALLEAKRRRKKLTNKPAAASNVNGKSVVNGKAVERPRKNSKTLEKEKQTDRTTRMLLAVLLLFLITEFPQGIMGLLNVLLGDAFLMECYLRLSDLMDVLALINSSINFILYCSMSKQFRSTFTLLFRPKFLDKWLPVAQDELAATRADGLRSVVAAAPDNCHTMALHKQPQVVTLAATTTTTTQVTNL